MANLTSVTTNYWPVANESFSSNLTSTVLAGATTVPINSMTQYADGDIVVLTVEPGTGNQATFIGVKASSPTRCISVVWTEGNVAADHVTGVTVTDYDSATHYDVVTKGIRQFANNDGTLKTSAVQAALNISSAVPPDYVALAVAPSTIVNNGNRSTQFVFPAVDYTDRLMPGTKLRLVRSVAAPTQSTQLNGTTQFYSKSAPAGMTFTDDFTVGFWIKLTSYASQRHASRWNGTNGWVIETNTSGQVTLFGNNGAPGNFSLVQSYQSLPLNRWAHVTAQLDMSSFTATPTTSYIMIDGIDVPAFVSRGGTNPTSLVQAGNLEIGSANSVTFSSAKLAQAFIASAKISQANIRSFMNQGITPAIIAANNIISAYSFDNSITDLNTTNANNLTANGSAVATNADSPFGIQGSGLISSTVEFAVVSKSSFSTDTTVVCQSPEGGAIPTSGGIASASYSSAGKPFGFPAQTGKWSIVSYLRTQSSATSNATFGSFLSNGWSIIPPIGEWNFGYDLSVFSTSNTNVYWNLGTAATVGVAAGSEDTRLTTASINPANTSVSLNQTSRRIPLSQSTATAYTMYTLGSTTTSGTDGDNQLCQLIAENALL